MRASASPSSATRRSMIESRSETAALLNIVVLPSLHQLRHISTCACSSCDKRDISASLYDGFLDAVQVFDAQFVAAVEAIKPAIFFVHVVSASAFKQEVFKSSEDTIGCQLHIRPAILHTVPHIGVELYPRLWLVGLHSPVYNYIYLLKHVLWPHARCLVVVLPCKFLQLGSIVFHNHGKPLFNNVGVVHTYLFQLSCLDMALFVCHKLKEIAPSIAARVCPLVSEFGSVPSHPVL